MSFETLEEDFNKLPFVTNYIELPLLNNTIKKNPKHPEFKPRPHWEEMITPKIGALINQMYEQDFKRFGYEMRKY